MLYASRTRDFATAVCLPSPWLSALLLDILVPGCAAPRSMEANLAFILSTGKEIGRWRFFDDPSYTVPYDSDDTALALMALSRHHVDFRMAGAEDAFLQFRDAKGRFLTWFDLEIENELDVVVNANVCRFMTSIGRDVRGLTTFLLGYFTSPEHYQPVVRFYDNPIVVHYFIVRALIQMRSVESEELLHTVVLPFLARHRESIFANPSSIAMTLTILTQLGYESATTARLVDLIVRSQLPDGSWPATPIVIVPHWVPGGPYFAGAQELTAGLCLEALIASAQSGDRRTD